MKHKYQPITNKHILYNKQAAPGNSVILNWTCAYYNFYVTSLLYRHACFRNFMWELNQSWNRLRRKTFLVKPQYKMGPCGHFRLKWACPRVRLLQQLHPSGNLSKNVLLSSADWESPHFFPKIIIRRITYSVHYLLPLGQLLAISSTRTLPRNHKASKRGWWEAKTNILTFIQLNLTGMYWEYTIHLALCLMQGLMIRVIITAVTTTYWMSTLG